MNVFLGLSLNSDYQGNKEKIFKAFKKKSKTQALKLLTFFVNRFLISLEKLFFLKNQSSSAW
ncbi:Uncharacterised protein [Candidatus Ornithobacterium hominis]|uniref:Uncharacterized protein n=1 Tax=Candidatus Ornithobacterium hominis TaxID=2497989 RepID=A0A383TWL1_9FLAO|nr:Uncharacterised protein [Candidatus Ornithobacterium hominis]